MDAKTLVNNGVCTSFSQAKRLLQNAPESEINEMIKEKRLESLTGLTQIPEIEFQQYMKDKTFSINEIRNSTQFLIRGDIIGLAIFDNAKIKESKFYLKKVLN